jgi:hypothetical protein
MSPAGGDGGQHGAGDDLAARGPHGAAGLAEGGAGREHVVDDEDASAREIAARGEAAVDVGRAGGDAEAGLVGGAAREAQRVAPQTGDVRCTQRVDAGAREQDLDGRVAAAPEGRRGRAHAGGGSADAAARSAAATATATRTARTRAGAIARAASVRPSSLKADSRAGHGGA